LLPDDVCLFRPGPGNAPRARSPDHRSLWLPLAGMSQMAPWLSRV
jgi:hypothetical protein